MPQQKVLIKLVSQLVGSMTMSVLGFSVLASVIRYTSAPVNSLTSLGIKQLACKS